MSGQDLTHQQPLGPEQHEEIVDGVPVLADVRQVEHPRPVLAGTRAVAAAATGFVAGAATVAFVRWHGTRRVVRAQRQAPSPVDLLPIVASRRFLIDVHVIAKPEE